jgi:hypothetical protein
MPAQIAGYALGLSIDAVVVMCGRVRAWREVHRAGSQRRCGFTGSIVVVCVAWETNDYCPGKSLVPGGTCTVGVESTHIAENTTSQTNLNVSSDNSQPGGWTAPLIAGCDARLMPC